MEQCTSSPAKQYKKIATTKQQKKTQNRFFMFLTHFIMKSFGT